MSLSLQNNNFVNVRNVFDFAKVSIVKFECEHYLNWWNCTVKMWD